MFYREKSGNPGYVLYLKNRALTTTFFSTLLKALTRDFFPPLMKNLVHCLRRDNSTAVGLSRLRLWLQGCQIFLGA
jgi:hypothetical protein